MSKTDFIDLLKYPFSHRARRRVRDRRKQIKLIRKHYRTKYPFSSCHGG